MKKKPKDTATGGLKPEKTNTRSQSKYPALDKKKNLPSRQDMIDFDYLSKLNESEMKFLNDFVEETVVTNFSHHKLIKGLLGKKKYIIEDDTVQEMKLRINDLKEASGENTPEIKELKLLVREIKKQNEEIYASKLARIEKELIDLRDQFLLYPDKEDHKVFYSENNSRNMCLLNKKKTEQRLDELDPESYDEMADSAMYNISAEDDLIDSIERSKWEAEEDRLQDIISQEKRARRNQKT